MQRMRTLVVLAATALGLGACRSKPAGGPPIRVAGAADLAFAFREVGVAFEKEHHRKVSFTFGSTGLLAKQIEQGAPFDVFAAANVSFADQVIKAAGCDATTKRQYARGRIVIWSDKDGVAPARSLADLADPRFTKIAIANPEHAPYGKAAQDALTQAGLWEVVRPKLVYGENIQQTLQYAQTGNVDAAIVALSLAIVTEGGHYAEIPATGHKPIDQALVVCGQGKNEAGGRSFAAFVSSEKGRAIMRRYGFLLPGETLTAAR